MSDDLAGLSVLELLRLPTRVAAELRRRGVLRTDNQPLGDYAEHLCACAFGWTLEPNSRAGHDAVSATGRRFQIKARRATGRVGDRQLGVIADIDGVAFDDLVVVLFEDDFTVRRAAILTTEDLAGVARRKGKCFVVHASDGLFDRPGVVDVTERLRAAQAKGRETGGDARPTGW